MTYTSGSDGGPGTDSDTRSLRRRVFDVIEPAPDSSLATRSFEFFIVALILLNVAAFVVETVPSILAAWGPWLHAFELISVGVFTAEYMARLWTAPEFPFLSRRPELGARLKYASSPSMVIDALAILPFYMSMLVSIDLRVLRVLRLFRLLKLGRYSPALSTLIRVIANEQRALLGAALLLMMAVLFSATMMYYVEGTVQPDKFGTIPHAAWWAITTLTTVGYGDVTPVTYSGRVIAGLTMITGLCILALPVAIIASGFSQELAKRDFVVNWSLISRVPFLSSLEPKEAAQVVPLLHAQSLNPYVEIVAKGAPADAMFIVASGKVQHFLENETRTYTSGQCFGIDSMIEFETHSGPFITAAKTKILKLHRDDFHKLEISNPKLAERLKSMHFGISKRM